MPNPAAWTFWLKERQVTGLIVAEHREEKLVEYAKRFYVVKGKDPQRRHYTQSTIPALWKKVMTGQLSVEEEMKELGVSKKDVKAARGHRDAVREQAKAPKAGVTSPPSPHPAVKAKPEAKLVASPASPQKPERKPSARKKPADAPPAAAASAVEPKQPAKRKAVPSPALPADQSILWLECPYCKKLELISAFDQEMGKAHIRRCGNCKQEFGLRVVPVAFRIEVAPFPGKVA